MKHWSKALPHKACADAVKWARIQPSAAVAWRECKRGDWMLWLLEKRAGASGSDARKPLVLAACECARLALPCVQKGELRPLKAIKTAEAWARGENVTLDEVRVAAADAAAAAYAAYAAYAADAAAAAYAAADAAAYAYAADAAAYAYVRSVTLKQCAGIVRKYYPEAPVLS